MMPFILHFLLYVANKWNIFIVFVLSNLVLIGNLSLYYI